MLKVIRSKSILALVFVAFLTFWCGGGLAFAESTKYQTEIPSILQVVIPDTDINVVVDPATKPFDSADFSITVATNNITGYKLMVSSDSTSLLKTDDASKTIPTLPALEGGYTQDTFETNRWGYKKDSGNYVPFVSGTELMRNDITTNGDTAALTFATKVDFLQPSGVYQTELNFVAVANPLPTYIQNLDDSLCTEQPLIVVDARDNQEYTVARLADGNCWMTENLNLGAEDLLLPLTSKNTNTKSNVDIATFNSWKNVAPNYDVTSFITVDGTDPVNGTKYGVLYDYCAVTAGTYCYPSDGQQHGNAASDICPVGWRLPIGGEDTDAKNEFKKLKDLYDGSDYDKAIKMRAPISDGGAAFALAGYKTGSGITGSGITGLYWSSVGVTGRARTFSLYTASTDTANFSERAYGLSVRCILKFGISKAKYMQDITTAMVDSTDIGEVATVKDKRDEKEYLIGKLADGNVWMLDNLALDPTEVSLEKLKGNTNASDETLTYFKIGGGEGAYAAEGVALAVNTNRRDTPTVVTKYMDVVPSGGYSSGKAGVYYNYCAVSAGSYCYADGAPYAPGTSYPVDITEDICPADWRLPTASARTNYNYETGTNEYEYSDYRNLISLYDSLTAFYTAFHVTFANGFYNYSPTYSTSMGSRGYLWAGSQQSTSSGKLMSFDNTYYGFTDTDRSRIFNTRCMFKK